MDKKNNVLLVGFSQREASDIGGTDRRENFYNFSRLWETTSLALPEERWIKLCAQVATEKNKDLLKRAHIVAVNMDGSPDRSLYIGAAKALGGKIVIGVYPYDSLVDGPPEQFLELHISLTHAHLDYACTGMDDLWRLLNDKADTTAATEATQSTSEETAGPAAKQSEEEY